MCARQRLEGLGHPPRLPSRLSLGAAIVDFHPQLWAGLQSGIAQVRASVGCGSYRPTIRRLPHRIQAYTRSAMAEQEPKGEREQPSVLGTLPSARPERLGAPRVRAKKAPAAKRRAAKKPAARTKP